MARLPHGALFVFRRVHIGTCGTLEHLRKVTTIGQKPNRPAVRIDSMVSSGTDRGSVM